MLQKAALATVVLVGLAGLAVAQTAPGTGGATTGTTTQGATSGTSAPGHLTESQVKQKLEQEGYSNIQLKPAHSSAGGSGTTSGSGSSSR